MAKTKNKKANLADTYAKKRKLQMVKKTFSPFEVHINRDKQKVLGRKSKADRGLPGVARTKAISKRKNTLLMEYKVRHKDNMLLDKRIGEKNIHMSEEDKAIARFAAERIKGHKKKDIFNLNDDEVLTHRGQSLIDIEKYDDPRSDEEDYDGNDNKSGKLDKKFVEDAHFGGGLLSKPDSEMSRKDLIHELIVESKKRKAERQKLKEQTEDLTEKLDTEWRDLLPLISSSNKKNEEVDVKTKVDDYDIAMRQLKFEARGNPTDKLKSEEVIAKEEKEKLEKLEQARLTRMQGFSDEADKSNHRSADDLDDFHIEEIKEASDNEEGSESNGLDLKDNEENEDVKKSEDEKDEDEENDGEESSADVESDNEVENGEKQINGKLDEENADSESEDDLSDLKVSESESEEETLPIKQKTKSISSNNVKDQESKQTIEQPEDTDNKLKEFCEPNKIKDIEIKSITNEADVVKTILNNGHYRIVDKNKENVLNLFSYMLQYIDKQASINSSEDVVKYFEIFGRLCPHFYDLAHVYPVETKKCMHDTLNEKHTKFEENQKMYPDLNTLSLFKLVSILYPTSDFRHPIVTPCLVFMSQILLRCKVRKKTDISKGLFVSSLILEYNALSKRWSPAIINFLRGIIYVSLPKSFSKVIKVIPPFKSVGGISNILLLEENHKKSDIDLVNIKMQAKDLFEEDIDDEFRLRTFVTAIKLLSEFQKNCSELEAAFSIFKPIYNLLKHGSIKRFPKNIQDLVNVFISDLEQLKVKKLEPLAAAQKKPKALKLYEPRIEVVYEGRKHPRMPKEQVEISKLYNKIKKEKKSAIREIRRDNAFLSKVKIKQQIASDAERKRKVKEIFGDAAMQQHELKKFKKK
ncbi:nucleolar protein 14 homolog [Phymastichus coffea]|uniref:nucleolar protein 14 homolog n=1 Tax=Phymastichus coffea TaxID=108790 RepID=UPI00273AD17E|nr:nucleolar protein 14 homolog [Phymastichus coffea]XP_058803661.1 nucleolar protein 14 homolog [Phymastichus coffea]